ncbi:L,D-transpeptidase family protein [Schaalia sp. 19OD2882]|uniref:L,D-transpeptidase family protein n=1 Tax=Schaalia sp. 19OD2882 TaxID=2794089 RepID=UPI001C1E9638|nr:L,D-transpeptidase family protein [Schaalia sp. 19OD2882]QWW19394.1 L,D-transpeptidase family protein [Schaalia sp. 19OD2882]
MVGVGLLQVGDAHARAMPGVHVADVDVTGLTEEEIVRTLDARFAGRSVDVEVDGHSVEVSLTDLGVVVDTRATARAALSTSTPLWNAVMADSAAPVTVPLVTSVDARVAEAPSVIDKAVTTAPTDAEVRRSASSGDFEASPGSPGQRVDPIELAEQVQSALSASPAQEPLRVSATPRPTPPAVTTAEARAAATAANTRLAQEVTLAADGRKWTAEAHVKATWLKVVTIDSQPTLSVDRAQVRTWVDQVADRFALPPVSEVVNVDEAGKVLEKFRPARPGKTIGQRDALVSAIETALLQGTPLAAEMFVEEVPAATENRVVSAGPERFAHAARPDEKWIDVNLAERTMTAYVGTSQVHGPVAMNDGGQGHPTVEGTFKIYHKMRVQDLGCSSGYDWCVPQVPWISYFEGDFAIHAAPWAHTFGLGSGLESHGCVNVPVEDAKWIFEWAPEGTVVVSHR